MAKLFGSDLDRKTLWDRIGSALTTSTAKVSDDDIDRFASLCLEHVKADPGHTAACEPLLQILTTAAARTPEWRHEFLQYFATHGFAVIAHGRARWKAVLEEGVEL